MSKLEEQLADYFGALHDDDRFGSGDGLRPYALADPAIAPPPPPDRRRMAVVLVGIVVVAALATLGLVKGSEDSSPYVETPVEQARPTPPPVPDGWKPVIFGSVQFAVPADWPVYDDTTCIDRSRNGVYLALLPPDPDVRACGLSYATPQLVVEAHSFEGDTSEFVAGDEPVDDTAVSTTTRTERSLNGLRAVIVTSAMTEPDSYTVALPDEDVIIAFTLVEPEQVVLMEQIIEAIGAAPETPSTSAVSTSTTTTPAPGIDAPIAPGDEGDLDAWCAAIEQFRSSGQILESSTYGPETAGYVRRIRDAAPEELRAPFETFLAWIDAGSPTPKPSEVLDAELRMTQDWAANCSGSNAKTAEERAQAGR